MKKSFLLIYCSLCLLPVNLFSQVEKRVYVDKTGTLINNFTEEEANATTHLTITGKINAIDFKHLREGFERLEILDLSNAEIKAYTGKAGTHPDKLYLYPSNCIPAYAFCTVTDGAATGKASLRKVILSEKTRNIEDAAFKGCKNLKILQIKKKTPPNLMAEALADSITAVFVPPGSRDEYRFKNRWENFAILEGEPVAVNLQIGSLESLKDEIQQAGQHPRDINYLTIEGKLNPADFLLIRDYMPNLVSVDMSKTTATAIPDFIFAQKKFLMMINLPANLKSIGQRAFSSCERLSGSVVLPPSVNRVDFGAFMGCTNLKQVVITGEYPTTLGENIFGDEGNKFVTR